MNESAGWSAAASAADLTLELPNGGGPMFFRQIPAGSFPMGSRGLYERASPQVVVVMPHAMYMATFPVTRRQFSAWDGVDPKWAHRRSAGDAALPATSVLWSEAMRYCEAMQRAPGVPRVFTVLLPSEVEWEYSCRAGTTTEYWSGDGEAALAEVAWYGDNNNHQPVPVGSKLPNPWGLCDVNGTVWEWCLDPWDPFWLRRVPARVVYDAWRVRELARSNGQAVFRVRRGGAWDSPADGCRSGQRLRGRPGYRSPSRGFRVFLVPRPASEPIDGIAEGVNHGRV